MKKPIAIVLSLILMIGVVFAAPITYASAVPTGPEIANGTWYDKPQVSGSSTFTGSNGSVTIPVEVANHNTSVYRKITGLETFTTYTLTMNYTSTVAGGSVQTGLSGITQATDEEPSFTSAWYLDTAQNPLLAKPVASDGKYTLTFTTAGTVMDYFLVFRVLNGNGAITLSNFVLTKTSSLEISDVDTENIADGIWYDKPQVSGAPTFKGSNGSVTIPVQVANNNTSVYRKLTDLQPNANYTLTMNYSSSVTSGSVQTGLSGITPATDNAPTFTSAWYLDTAQSPLLGKPVANNGTYTISFSTTNETEYFLVFRVLNGNGAITLSNFSLVLEEETEEDRIAQNIPTLIWYDMPQVTGARTFTGANGEITIPVQVANNNTSVYTKITNLEEYATYTLTMDYESTVAGGSAQTGFSGITPVIGDSPTFTSAWYLDTSESPLLAKPVANNGKYTITFTADGVHSDYFLVFRVLGGNGAITLSNFTLEKNNSKGRNADGIVNNKWSNTGTATLSRNQSAHTVTFEGVANQTIYTVLTGLETTSTYTFSLQHNAEEASLFGTTAYVVAGNEISFDENQVPTGAMLQKTNISTDTDTVITFTTNQTDHEYVVAFRVGNISNLTLSHFALKEKNGLSFVGPSISKADSAENYSLTFKNKVDKSLLADGYNGNAIVEIGTVAAITSRLNDTPLTLSHPAAQTDVAYKTTNSIRRFTSEDSQYAYLFTNISGLTSDYYHVDISVVAYLKLQNGTVLYGDVQTNSIYEAFRFIQTKGSATEKERLSVLLEDSAIRTAFANWKTQNPPAENSNEYFFSLRTNSIGSSLVLSNFTFTENGVAADTARILGGDWYHNQNNQVVSNGSTLSTPANNVQNNAITISSTGCSFYTRLSDLTPNTTYQISFHYNVAAGMQYPGGSGVVWAENAAPVYNMSTNHMPAEENDFISTYSHDKTNQTLTYTFTTKGPHQTITDGDATDDKNDIAAGTETNTTPTVLEVYNAQTPINQNYLGMNATVYHSFGFMNDGYQYYTDVQRNTELARLERMGFKNCRTMFHESWVDSGTPGSWNFNATTFQEFANYCNALEDRDMGVMLNVLWYTFMFGNGNRNSAAQTYLSGFGDDMNGETTAYSNCIANEHKLSGSMNPYEYSTSDPMGSSTADFSETTTAYFERLSKSGLRYGYLITEIIRELKARGVNNIDYLLYFTEPSIGDLTVGGDPTGRHNQEYLFVAKTIKNVLVANQTVTAGLKHVGPNQGPMIVSGGLLDYVLSHDPNLFDIYTAHFYPAKADATEDGYYTYTYNALTNLKKDFTDNNLWNAKDFWIDETFSIQTGDSQLYCRRDVPATGVQTVVSAICAQQMGVDNSVMWQAFDQKWYQRTETAGEYVNGIHITGTAPSLFTSNVPYKTYYTTGLFTRFNNSKSGGKAIATSTGTGDGGDGIYIGAVELPDGNFTITVANAQNITKKIRIELDEAIGKDIHRYAENTLTRVPTESAQLAECKATFKNVTTSILDTIEPWSVYVYTTSKKPCNQ